MLGSLQSENKLERLARWEGNFDFLKRKRSLEAIDLEVPIGIKNLQFLSGTADENNGGIKC